MDLQFLETILECSVCLERLKQDARVLPCQHTFCLDCLKRVANKNPQTALQCPECRQQTNTFDLDTLPKNVFLIRLLDQISQSSSNNIAAATTTLQGPAVALLKNDENSTPTAVSSSATTTTTKSHDLETQIAGAPAAAAHANIPYAKALYDFIMNPMDDEGCIKFQKGMIIQVTRRVDQNWAEGKIDETLGIFPLSFVQLNPAATALMQSYATKWRLPASISPEHAPSTSSNSQQQQQPRAQHLPVLQPTPTCPTTPSSNKSGLCIAIHNYAPLKPDELELKKGSQYIVTDACKDGWLRGASSENPTKKGSFPGNFVISLAYHQKLVALQQLQQQRNASALQTQNMNTQQVSRSTGAYTNLGLASLPPELPQRNNPSTNKNTPTPPSAQQSPPQMMKTEEINKKRESVSEILLKKLGYKKSTDNSASYSMDNPVFDDSAASACNKQTAALQYNHMRSGSCPVTFQPNATKSAPQQNPDTKMKFGSHSTRVKTRQRPSLPLCSSGDEMISVAHQQKRHSINLSAPPTTSNELQNTQHQQQQQQIIVNHRKSSSLDTTIDGTVAAPSGSKLERYRCVTKYPAMSRVELSLNVGDIIILQKKRPNGWYKGELSRTGQIGLFPANFVELIE